MGNKNFLKNNPIQMMRTVIPLRAFGSMFKILRKIQKGKNQSLKDIEPYFENLNPVQFEPKPKLWNELNLFIQENWNNVDIGFTELLTQMMFKGKYTLFRYALIVSQGI